MPRLHAVAQEEIRAAAFWYDERVPGLGEKLLAEVEAALAGIEAFPRSGARWQHAALKTEVRRSNLRTFPYALFYVLAPDPYVLAFAHSAREPGYWVARLGDAT